MPGMQKFDVKERLHSSVPQENIQKLDLQLLSFLTALLQTASITQAGELVGWSQPNASRSAARLRSMLGDPLLVRTSAGYALTPFALGLESSVNEAVQAMRKVFQSAQFSAALSARRFELASTDYGVLAVVSSMLPAFAQQAPHAAMVVRPWNKQTLAALEMGEIDLALYADDALPQDFHYRELFTERFALLVRRAHPLLRAMPQKASLKQFVRAASAFTHVVARYPEGRLYLADDVMRRLGSTSHRVVMESPYFATAPWMIGASDLLMVLPLRAARMMATSGMHEVLPLPQGAPVFSYRLVWHERAHRDPGNAWLRQALITSAAAPPSSG